MKDKVQELAREKISRFWLKQTKGSRLWLGFLFLLMIGLVLPVVCFLMIYRDRVFPGVVVAGTPVGGYKFTELAYQLSMKTRDYTEYEKLVLSQSDSGSDSGVLVWEMGLDELGVEFDPIQTADNAFSVGREGDLQSRIRNILAGFGSKHEVVNKYSYSTDKYRSLVETVVGEVDKPGAPANIKVLEDGAKDAKIVVFLGENGVVVDKDEVKRLFEKKISKLEYGTIELPLVVQNNTISQRQAEQAKLRAEKLLGLSLEIVVKDEGLDKSWILSGQDLISFMNIGGGFSGEKIETYVKELKEAVDRPPQNALFKFENGRVLEFAPGLNGLVVNEEKSIDTITEALVRLENENTKQVANLIVDASEPDLKTPDVNDLGIKELIGRGESTYFHSIPGRVFNVAHTANKLNGVLIPPGETFSFNQAIGDISAATGFKSAYVIKDGRTVLGDGGGVCQDSTTLFRAIMDAGLPIVERRGHSYRVGYYEQNSEPGYDATVYSPSVDLKFKNDTPAHVLIQAKADSINLKLVIELYGTNDGRVSEISNYQKWGALPAPPPLYQDDPSLAPGVIKQVDWAASGLKTKFDYRVTRGGETIFEKTFYTTYQPWRAVYLRGI